ncbi:MAG: IS1634 family transposase [Planctomycetota bacterium]|jgi:transposase
MFARTKKLTSGGKEYQYVQIVEAYRDNGRPKQRVVASLGRLDLLGDKLDDLVSSLRKYCRKPFTLPDERACQQALPWGTVLLTRHLWEQVNLSEIIGQFCRSPRKRYDVAEMAFVLVANRLCEPRSEHGLARWLEHTFVCDRRGRRWEPDWLPAQPITKKQRVKVRFEQLNRWYRTLDALLGAKEQIEEALYLRVRDLFSLKVDMVFYDLTSLYFCRRSPKGTLRRHGPSKDGKSRQVQIMLGVVMANGWPIAHHVFAGNTAEKKTLIGVLRDLEKRFGLNRVMVVGDRGMVSPANLEFLSGTPFRYLLGIPGRRCEEAVAVLDALDDEKWERVDEGNRVQEVNVLLPGNESVRHFVIDSQERKVYEEAMRQRSMERARQALEKVAAAVQAGRLKDQAKIGARAQRALSQHHGYRYYSWDVGGRGQFRFFEDPDKLQAEMRHEGKYIVKTDDAALTAGDAVSAYKELSTVEWGFRDLKDVIEGRPIFHQRGERVEAHIFVATLALFLKRTLDHQLAAELPELSSTDAFAAMESIGIAELSFNGQTSRLVSGGGRDARRVLAALGIKDSNPPSPHQSPRGAQK